ncbi:putative ABC-type transport system involved in lysophospholipase L1 biosynthesis ATPase subunit [Bacillus sp. 3255]|nr:putative ABC-type transport system involved in lysophospholipase L1 biosynthesis ATPase subunit [Bacillus sp. 3255]
MNILGCLDVADRGDYGLNDQGRTIVITHDLAIAQQAKRVVYFRDG